jgi:hypothetical protein
MQGGRELSSAQYAGDLYRGGDGDAVDVESLRYAPFVKTAFNDMRDMAN